MSVTMAVTTHEVASALQGGATMCSFTSGEEALLRKRGTPVDSRSLAERRALDDNLMIVQLDQDELFEVARGRTVVVIATNGIGGAVNVEVRMMTADELLAAHAAACRKVGGEPMMTRAEAERLTATL
jgi:hypothetical protein